MIIVFKAINYNQNFKYINKFKFEFNLDLTLMERKPKSKVDYSRVHIDNLDDYI